MDVFTVTVRTFWFSVGAIEIEICWQLFLCFFFSNKTDKSHSKCKRDGISGRKNAGNAFQDKKINTVEGRTTCTSARSSENGEDNPSRNRKYIEVLRDRQLDEKKIDQTGIYRRVYA